MESDVVKRLEAYPAEDVVMELPRTAIPDDEFHEEPHLEEEKVPEEIPNGVRLAVMRIHKNLGHPGKELLCRTLRIGGASCDWIEVRRLLGEKPPKSHLPAKLANTYTEFNQGVGNDLFMLADSDEQVFEFPVPSKRPDDVSSLEMVWINWAGPMQNGLVERNGGIWKAAARKAIKDVGARGFVEMRRLAFMVNWAKNARINPSG